MDTMPKIIQIINNNTHRIVALCEDGSIWIGNFIPAYNPKISWYRTEFIFDKDAN